MRCSRTSAIATVACSSGWATRWCSRRGRRAAGRCTSTPATWREALPVVRHHVEVFERGRTATSRWRRPVPASDRSGTSTRWSPAGTATNRSRSGPRTLAARTYELSELLVDVLGVDRRRRLLPAPGDLPPDLSFAADAAGRGQAAAPAARGARASTWSNCPPPNPCCGFGGTFALKNSETSTAMLADKMSNVLSTGRRGVLRRRLVLPDAHRRRPVPAAQRGPHRPSRPDPGVAPRRSGAPHDARSSAAPTCHAGTGNHPCAAPNPSRRGAEAARQHRSCAPTWRTPPARSGTNGRRGRRDAGLGGSCAARVSDQDGRDGAAPGAAGAVRGERHRPRRGGALGARRGGGEPDRHRPGAGHRCRRGA